MGSVDDDFEEQAIVEERQVAPVPAPAPRPRRWRCAGCCAGHPGKSVGRPPGGWVTLVVHKHGAPRAKIVRLFCSKQCLVNWTYNKLRGVQDYPVVPVEHPETKEEIAV